MNEDIRWIQRFSNYKRALKQQDTSRAAFANGIITDGDAWMSMVKSRNLISHTSADLIYYLKRVGVLFFGENKIDE